MAEVVLHYSGLKNGQHTYFWNKVGGYVPVYPRQWVRLDLSRHSEVQNHIENGIAEIKKRAPSGRNVLTEGTDPNRLRRRRVPGLFKPRRREASKGKAEVLELTESELNQVAQCFLPWPNFQEDFGMKYVDGRLDKGGAGRGPRLHRACMNNFPVLYRIAELKGRRARTAAEVRLKRNVQSSYDHGVIQTEHEKQEAFNKRRRRLPTKSELIRKSLSGWGVWDGANPPSRATFYRYLAELGASRREIDDLILEAHQRPRRIILA